MKEGGFRFRSKLERRIVRRAGAAVGEFDLIREGDHLLVAVSGGKDSLALLEVLHLLERRAPIRFEMTAVTIDQGQPHTRWLESHYRRQGYIYRIVPAPIQEVVAAKLEGDAIPCSLCSRLRRGILYTLAPQMGCNKIVLGHHLDDLIETLLLNLFFSGQLRAMAPRLVSDDGRNVVIRPLCDVPEAWLETYSAQRGFLTATCAAGCAGEHSRRSQTKQLVAHLAEQHPGLRDQMRRAMRNIKTEHLLDRELLGRVAR